VSLVGTSSGLRFKNVCRKQYGIDAVEAAAIAASYQNADHLKQELAVFIIIEFKNANMVVRSEHLKRARLLAVLDLSEKDFVVGLSYVAISRAKTIDGVMFKHDFGKSRFQGRPSVRRMRNLTGISGVLSFSLLFSSLSFLYLLHALYSRLPLSYSPILSYCFGFESSQERGERYRWLPTIRESAGALLQCIHAASSIPSF
jgi:hypothetical protein